MYVMKKLEPKDFRTMVDIVGRAYPDFYVYDKDEKEKLIENYIRQQEEHPYINTYGAFQGDNLVGCMRFHDYQMNLLAKEVKVGGIGLVAVDLLHKKEKVAREIVTYFLNHYRNQGAVMALLYPFRPDFYKNMGFGFGTSMNQFKVKPSDLPNKGNKERLVYLKTEDIEKMCECYNRFYRKTNGLLEKHPRDYDGIFKNPLLRVVGCRNGESIEGFLVFEFKQRNKDTLLSNNLVIKSMVFETIDAFDALMTFLHTQDDQVRQVIFHTQDEGFRYVLNDPRDGSDNLFYPVYHQTNLQGTGIMYRVLDVKRLFQELSEHDFNGISCRLGLHVKDNLMADNNGDFVIAFHQGHPQISEGMADVWLTMDISDFSSLVTCAVDLKTLVRYGRAQLSEQQWLWDLDKLFSSSDKPLCMTQF